MTKIGTLKTIRGDITKPQFTGDDEIIVIPHCCNNGDGQNGIGVMGAGVALALRKKWPKVYDVYKKMESKDKNGLSYQLGDISAAIVEYYAKGHIPKIVVVNMIAQDGLKNNFNPHPIKYWALLECMRKVRRKIINNFYSYKRYVIHCPEFGSVRAGGKWEVILELIREQWLDYGIDVVVYKFE